MKRAAFLILALVVPSIANATSSECKLLAQKFYDNDRWLAGEARADLIWPGSQASRIKERGRALNQKWYYVNSVRANQSGAVDVKVVSLSLNGMEYTGEYAVIKARFICEARDAETRISEIDIMQREVLTNYDGRGFNPM